MREKVRLTKMLVGISVLILVVPPWFLTTVSSFWQMSALAAGTLLLIYSTFVRMSTRAEKEYWNCPKK